MAAWVERYRPQRLKDVAGNPGAVEALTSWIGGWKEGVPEKRAVLLYGPAGTGKTSVAHAMAKDLGYDSIELNASDTRTKGVIDKIVGAASSLATLDPAKGRKVLILDEVDGIHGKWDHGGLAALKGWVKESLHPMVLIANDPWKLPKEFRALTLMIDFKRIDQRTVVRVLKEICSKEGIETDEKVLKVLASNANGDLRSAINDLQAMEGGRKRLDLKDLDMLTLRDTELKIFDTIGRIFKTENCDRAREAVRDSGEDPETILKWVVENLPLEYEDPKDLAEAFRWASRADIYLGRIMRRQDWGLMSYAIDAMSAGVALAKGRRYQRFVRYQYPQVFVLYARTRKEREVLDLIAGKVAPKVHSSKRDVRVYFMPMIRTVMENDLEMGAAMASAFELFLEEIEYILKDEEKAKEVYKRAQAVTEERLKRHLRRDARQASLSQF